MVSSNMHPTHAATLGKVAEFLQTRPDDGPDVILSAINRSKILYSTEDVMDLTGWSHTYVLRLCKTGKLPHIPGNPHKFMIQPLMQALYDMQTGGMFGRRKSTLKKAA